MTFALGDCCAITSMPDGTQMHLVLFAAALHDDDVGVLRQAEQALAEGCVSGVDDGAAITFGAEGETLEVGDVDDLGRADREVAGSAAEAIAYLDVSLLEHWPASMTWE